MTFCSGGGNSATALGDVNGDGRLDTIATGHGVKYSHITVHFNLEAPSPGVSSFGTGTPGCVGIATLGTSSTPSVGNASFAVTGTNAPPFSLGALLFADESNAVGSDVFGLGLLVHLDFFGAAESGGIDVRSDASGTSYSPIPLPNNPVLAGKHYFVQSFWMEPLGFQCSPALFSLVSSRGLDLTIQP
jgi:hypothetical protein